MSRLRFAVVLAAAAATGVFVGPAVAGVHVTTVPQSPISSGVWQPGVIPKLGIDVNELRPAVGEQSGTPAARTRNGEGPNGGWTGRSESWQHEHDEQGGDDEHGNGGGGQLSVPNARSSSVSGPPGGQLSFHGLDHWDSRFGGGTNQFSLEPSDQGLCVGGAQGGGQLLEIINNVARSYTTAGVPTSPDITSNTFFGYPPAFNRGTGEVGPQVTDPSCIFDARAQKYVVIALTFEVEGTGPNPAQPTGKNHIDIAVTTAAAPTKVIQRYMIPVQNDGTDGTPGGPNHPNCPCVGDFPQLGMDENGFYITTNEYPWFVDGFNGAQIYAFSRKQLEAGSPVLRVVHFDNLSTGGGPAFVVWPAKSNEGDYNRDRGGTENFLSSMAAPETGNAAGIDNRIAVWWLSKTRSLDTPTPEKFLRLRNQVAQTETYAIPPPADQKVGNIPLADCLNHDECAILVTRDGKPNPYKPEVEGPLDSGDSRILTHWYVNGELLGALGTALKVGGKTKAGIAWFAFDASSGRLQAQSYLAVANNNVINPAIATLPDGRGAMAFTLAGVDWYPSAAYALVQAAGNGNGNGGGDDEGDNNNHSGNNNHENGNSGRRRGSDGNGRVKVGNPTVASPGIDAQDGFSEYKANSPTGDGVPRPRWGDFGAAASTGTEVWIGSEYIGQTCGTSDWHHFAVTGFQCPDSPSGHLRTALANWGTRVTQVVLPQQNQER